MNRQLDRIRRIRSSRLFSVGAVTDVVIGDGECRTEVLAVKRCQSAVVLHRLDGLVERTDEVTAFGEGPAQWIGLQRLGKQVHLVGVFALVALAGHVVHDHGAHVAGDQGLHREGERLEGHDSILAGDRGREVVVGGAGHRTCAAVRGCEVVTGADLRAALGHEDLLIGADEADREVHDLVALLGDRDATTGHVELAFTGGDDRAVPRELLEAWNAVKPGTDLVHGVVVPTRSHTGVSRDVGERQVGVVHRDRDLASAEVRQGHAAGTAGLRVGGAEAAADDSLEVRGVDDAVIGVEGGVDLALGDEEVHLLLHGGLDGAAQPRLGQLRVPVEEREGVQQGVGALDVHAGRIGDRRLGRGTVRGVGAVGVLGHLQERRDHRRMRLGEAARRRDDVEHADAQGLLLGTGHHQVAARGQHRVDRPTERTRHRDVAVLEGGDRSRPALGGDEAHVVERHTQVLEHLEQLEVRHVADRRVDRLAGQRLGGVVLGHGVVGMRHTVVGVRVRHGHTDDHVVGTRRHVVGEGRQALRVRDVDVAGLHRQRHVVARREGMPIHRHPEHVVIGHFDLRHLVGRRPLQEVGDVQLVEATGVDRRGRLRSLRGHHRLLRWRCRRGCRVILVTAACTRHKGEGEQSTEQTATESRSHSFFPP